MKVRNCLIVFLTIVSLNFGYALSMDVIQNEEKDSLVIAPEDLFFRVKKIIEFNNGKVNKENVEDVFKIKLDKRDLVDPAGKSYVVYEKYLTSPINANLVIMDDYLSMQFIKKGENPNSTTGPVRGSSDCMNAMDLVSEIKKEWNESFTYFRMGYGEVRFEKKQKSIKKSIDVTYYRNTLCVFDISYYYEEATGNNK